MINIKHFGNMKSMEILGVVKTKLHSSINMQS